uniref:Isoform 3 of Endoplasmic reticulum membrane sensor NFE2L1 n=1 Tax=Mus musculus TaxID=10090 RepID=Q61985-2|nr:nuclear factor erythroid-related factor 1 [Mus musculus]
MEMQAMEVNTSASEILYNAPPGDPLSTNYSLAPNTPINQNVSLHQASLGGCSQDFSLFSPEVESLPVASSSTLLPLVPSNSTSLNSTFGSTNLAGLFFPSQLNGTANDTSGPELPDPLGGLLDEAMLDEISLMDLAIEEGFNPVQASQLEEEFDSEHRARAMKIPFTNDKIINLPVEEFNELLSKYQLSEAQLSLIRDIRRRGKNKMAAQNCRKRKLDTILNLERDVEDLQRDKARLLREKVEFLRSLRQMKQKVQSLYQEVFGRLRDEHGRPYSPSQYALQYAGDGSVLLIPRTMADQQARRQERKPKDRRK